MSSEKTYLELSDGTTHKFYEVTVHGATVTVRYGRIGDAGATSTASHPSAEEAHADAAKRVAEKTRKGYAPAVAGARAKRKVTRRSAGDPHASPPERGGGRDRAPLVWSFATGTSALGIAVDAARMWVGNEAGEVFALDPARAVEVKVRLPDGVKCIVADGRWLYAGCDDGNVYDLSGGRPRVAYSIAENVDLYWLDIYDGALAVSDAAGSVSLFGPDEQHLWTRKSKGDRGWMVRCDRDGVYHGHSNGVTKYDWAGEALWTRPTKGWIGFGWQEEALVFALTAQGTVHRFAKGGEVQTVYVCDAYLCSCATAPGGAYVFAGDQFGYLYCFREDGTRLWKLDAGLGAAQSMQYREGRLYVVTSHGYLGCVDVDPAAIERAHAGVVPEAVRLDAPAAVSASATEVETTHEAGDGVVLECYREGDALRVRVAAPGYDPAWHCQFPMNLRVEGARYVVREVVAARRGGFYRVLGEIRRLAG